jgi:hypothetical protein
MPEHPILFAIPDDQLRLILETFLQYEESPYPYRIVATTQAAREALSREYIRCLIMTKEVALGGDDGQSGLIATCPALPPTVTFIRPGEGYPDYIYIPYAFHTWCTLPFSLDALFGEIGRVLRRAEA